MAWGGEGAAHILPSQHLFPSLLCIYTPVPPGVTAFPSQAVWLRESATCPLLAPLGWVYQQIPFPCHSHSVMKGEKETALGLLWNIPPPLK